MADPIKILLVEDSPSDVRLTMEALREARLHNQIDVAPDGEAALTNSVDLDQFIRVVQSIQDFWLTIVKLPPPPGAEHSSRDPAA
jgi:hypothetical protein